MSCLLLFIFFSVEVRSHRVHAKAARERTVPRPFGESTSLRQIFAKTLQEATYQYSRMLDESTAAGKLAWRSLRDEPPSWLFYVAVVCLIWYTAVTLVSTLGYVQV
jgi:hypothetical protein